MKRALVFAVVVAAVTGTAAGWLAYQLRPRAPYLLGSGR